MAIRNTNTEKLQAQLDKIREQLKDIEKSAKDIKVDITVSKSDQDVLENFHNKIEDLANKQIVLNDLMSQNNIKNKKDLESLLSVYDDIVIRNERINSLKAELADLNRKQIIGQITDVEKAQIQQLNANISAEGRIVDLKKEQFKTANVNFDKMSDIRKAYDDILDAQEECNEASENANYILEKHNSLLEEQNKRIESATEAWNKTKDQARQTIDQFGAAIQTIIQGTEYWRTQDEAISKVSSQLGLSTSQLDNYRASLLRAGIRSEGLYGVSPEYLAKLQQGYDEATAKAILFNDSQIEAQLQLDRVMGDADSLEYLAGMEQFGVGVEYARDIWEDLYNTAKAQGVATGKASKDFVKNLQVAQRYNFKGGLDNLREMSVYATKMRISLETIGEIADKISNPEGAIETAARLQVLGGNFSSLANPLSMLYESLEDMEGLTTRIGDMFNGIGTFDKQLGEVHIGGMDRQRIKAAAEAMGMSYDEALNTVRERVKRNQIQQDVSFNSSLSNEDKDLLATLAQFNKKTGQFEVQIYNSNSEQYEARSIEEIDADTIDKIRGDETQDMETIVENTMSINDRVKQIAGSINASTARQQEKTIGTMARETTQAIRNTVVNNADLVGTTRNIYMAVESGFHTLSGITSAILTVMSAGEILGQLRYLGRSGNAGKLTNWARSTNGSLRGYGGKNVSAFSKGSLLKGAGYGLAAGAVGLGFDALGNHLKENGHENWGAVADVVGSIGQGAAMGAMFGPIGLAVGAVVGSITGVVENWDKVKEGVQWLWEGIVNVAKTIWNWNPIGIVTNIAKMAYGKLTGKEFEVSATGGVQYVNDAVSEDKHIVSNPNDSIMFAKEGGPIDAMFNKILPKIDEIHSLISHTDRGNFNKIYSDTEKSIKEIKEKSYNQQIIGKESVNDIVRAIPIGDTKSYFKEVRSERNSTSNTSNLFGKDGNITFTKPLEVKFSGTIRLDGGNGNNVDITSLIRNNPTFIKEITKLISDEVSSTINGGKPNHEQKR